jgi:hypothetical protein
MNTYDAELRAHKSTRENQRDEEADNPPPGLDAVPGRCWINVFLRNVIWIAKKDTFDGWSNFSDTLESTPKD